MFLINYRFLSVQSETSTSSNAAPFSSPKLSFLISFFSYVLKRASKSSSFFALSRLFSLFLFLAYLMSSLSSSVYRGLFDSLLSSSFWSRFFRIRSTLLLASVLTVLSSFFFSGSMPWRVASFLLIRYFLPRLMLAALSSARASTSLMSFIVFFSFFSW